METTVLVLRFTTRLCNACPPVGFVGRQGSSEVRTGRRKTRWPRSRPCSTTRVSAQVLRPSRIVALGRMKGLSGRMVCARSRLWTYLTAGSCSSLTRHSAGATFLPFLPLPFLPFLPIPTNLRLMFDHFVC